MGPPDGPWAHAVAATPPYGGRMKRQQRRASRLQSRTHRWAVRGIGAVAAVSVLAACGSGGPAPKATQQEPTARPADFLLDAADLPSGWRDSNSQGVDYRVTVCGVDLEPEPPAYATSVRYSKGPLGPFLEQHVRVYRSDVTGPVITKLRAALPTCTQYQARGTSPQSKTATFSVEPLTVKGAPEDSVAWRQTSQGELPVTSDLLLTRRGTTAVLLMSYALKAKPDPAVLEAAVASLPAGR